jgi:hypothetical protein
LTVERWARFTLAQQILSIAAEMLRARTSIERGDAAAVRLHYERVLRMVDLTVEAHRSPSLWRELLRWRGLIAELYVAPAPRREEHAELLRCLLLFTPESARQIAQL